MIFHLKSMSSHRFSTLPQSTNVKDRVDIALGIFISFDVTSDSLWYLISDEYEKI